MRPLDAHEICTGLWMGAMPPEGLFLAQGGFSIVALCAIEHQPSAEVFPGVDVARIELTDNSDTPLTEAQFQQALFLSAHLAYAVRRNRKVLITCLQGRNRSGLMTALAFLRLTGCSGLEALQTVRDKRRSPSGPALTNDSFARALAQIPSRGSLSSKGPLPSRVRQVG